MALRTAFYDFHVSAGAKMVEYAGWEMPLLYRGIVQEHQHTREKVSLFDVSHMGRLRFSGGGVLEFLQMAATRNLSGQTPGQSRYSLICNEHGGVHDDVIITRDERDWLMVCNAANRAKLLEHFRAVLATQPMDVAIDDQTETTAMLALQGPLAIERLGNVLPTDVASIKPHTFETVEVMFMKFQVFRGGYTGEDGVEIILSARAAAMAMKMLGGKLTQPTSTLQPAGLGARDTLRLEAALPLYGHELAEEIDPLSAGLAWAVDLNKDFIGAAALRLTSQAALPRQRAGLELDGRRIARQGASVLHNGNVVGTVTSGTFGPTVQKSIALARIDTGLRAEGTALAVDIGGTAQPAKVVKLPFYRRATAPAGR